MVSNDHMGPVHAKPNARDLNVHPMTDATKKSSSFDQTKVDTPQHVQAQRQELNAILERVARLDHRLSFTVDEASGKSVVVVRDARTSEVLKQFPSEEMLNVARRLEEHLSKQSSMTGVLHTDEA
jgi:flagellar protein FlaG